MHCCRELEKDSQTSNLFESFSVPAFHNYVVINGMFFQPDPTTLQPRTLRPKHIRPYDTGPKLNIFTWQDIVMVYPYLIIMNYFAVILMFSN